jgi:signal transduction histidine kinase
MRPPARSSLDRSSIASEARRFACRFKGLVGTAKTDGSGGRIGAALDAILVSTLVLLALLLAIILYRASEPGRQYGPGDVAVFCLVAALFACLFGLCRRGRIRAASWGLTLSYFAGSFYCGWRWGASLPATLLCFTLTMGVASLLLGGPAIILVMAASFAALALLSTHELGNPYVASWRNGPARVTDLAACFAIIAFLFLLSWMSRRETEASLARARESEARLAEERDLLDLRVRERTEELRRTQEDRVQELASIAEFGRISQGLFHDLVSPTSALILHLERACALPPDEARTAKECLERISAAAKRFGGYLSSVRTALGGSRLEPEADFEEELTNALNLLAWKARQGGVGWKTPESPAGRIPFTPALVHQILFNLLSNAADSYDDAAGEAGKEVAVSARPEGGDFVIRVADRGSGIRGCDLPRMFEPFFTTKKARGGTGVGLSSVKRAVEGAGGTIRVESEEGKGTEVTVTLPLRPGKALPTARPRPSPSP